MLLFLTIVSPFIVVCFYGVPSADDFWGISNWKNYEGNHLIYMVENSYKWFFSHQGTYFSCFLATLPIYYLFGITGVGFVYFLSSLFFVISLVFLLYVFSSLFEYNKDKKIFILCLNCIFFYYLLSTCPMDEIFYWWAGICVYTLPCSFMFLCLALLILSEKKHSRILLSGSVFSAFLASGGALNLAALLCSILLFVILYNQLFHGYRIKNTFIVFSVATLFSSINSLAPGNFVRHAVYDSDIHYFKSVLISFKRVFSVIFQELHLYNYQLVLFIFFSVLIGYFFYRHFAVISLRKILFVFCYFWLAIVIIDYPFILGYSSANYVPSRFIFVERLSISIFIYFLSVHIGILIYQKGGILSFSKVIIISLCMLSQMQDFGLRNFTSLKIIKHLYKNDYMNFYLRENGILEKIKLSKDNDVVITITPFESKHWTNLKPIEVSSDKNNWINQTVASFFNKKSLSVNMAKQSDDIDHVVQ